MTKTAKKTLVEQAEEDEQKEVENQLKHLSVAEKLMRRLESVVQEIHFDVDGEDFVVKTRMLSEKEQRGLMKLQRTLADMEFKDDEDYAVLKKQLVDYLAYPDGVCLDSSLDREFWMDGNYLMVDLFDILAKSVAGVSSEMAQDVKSFRPE